MVLSPATHARYLSLQFAARSLLGVALFEKLRYLQAHHRWPRLRSAARFTEKVFARKLGRVDARFPIVADKVAVRDWVAQRIGPQFLVPLLAVYRYDELDTLDVSPGQVLKCANRSGGVYFTSADHGMDRACLIKLLRRDLDFDFAAWTGESWYREIPKRVIAERSLSDADGSVPIDYKFFVFHGAVKAIQVHLDRFGGHRRLMFDLDWQLVAHGDGDPGQLPAAPRNLPRMIQIAESLGEEFDFVRIDLYEIDQRRIYFGELTLAPASGLKRFHPAQFDRVLGAYW